MYIDNNIGDEGARMLSEALKVNTAVYEMDLGCDRIWEMYFLKEWNWHL